MIRAFRSGLRSSGPKPTREPGRRLTEIGEQILDRLASEAAGRWPRSSTGPRPRSVALAIVAQTLLFRTGSWCGCSTVCCTSRRHRVSTSISDAILVARGSAGPDHGERRQPRAAPRPRRRGIHLDRLWQDRADPRRSPPSSMPASLAPHRSDDYDRVAHRPGAVVGCPLRDRSRPQGGAGPRRGHDGRTGSGPATQPRRRALSRRGRRRGVRHHHRRAAGLAENVLAVWNRRPAAPTRSTGTSTTGPDECPGRYYAAVHGRSAISAGRASSSRSSRHATPARSTDASTWRRPTTRWRG